MCSVNSSDAYGSARALISNATATFDLLGQFHKAYSTVIPSQAASRIQEFLSSYQPYFSRSSQTRDEQFQRVQFVLIVLSALRTEIDYLFTDTHAFARSLVERAFLHLQFSLIADPSIRANWRDAFQKGELACERLGATHLLLHGIWAFKAHGPGERTDLVLGTRLEITPQVESAAEALVLTEWKLVREPGDLAAAGQTAFNQAKMYGTGTLAGFELTNQRYLVMVSEKRLEMPPDHQEGSVAYQHKNIAVAPEAPSTAA